MLFECCTNHLNKEKSGNVKVFSGLVITYTQNKAGLKINCSDMLKLY